MNNWKKQIKNWCIKFKIIKMIENPQLTGRRLLQIFNRLSKKILKKGIKQKQIYNQCNIKSLILLDNSRNQIISLNILN